MTCGVRQTPESFWARVDKTGDCWNWTGGCNNIGYGTLGYHGKKYVAHRVAAYLVGMVPSMSQPDRKGCGHVLHKCDNRKCCNPSHLYVGTIAQNVADAVARNRLNNKKGVENSNAVLTQQHLDEIAVALPAGATCAELARKYGVHYSTIWRAITGRNGYKLPALSQAKGFAA